jgi:hypothetical protein
MSPEPRGDRRRDGAVEAIIGGEGDRALAATIRVVTMADTALSDEAIFAMVVIANTGSHAWHAPSVHSPRCIALSYHVRNLAENVISWDGYRTVLCQKVSPGDSMTMYGLVIAPREPGDYLIDFDIVSEGECWFECQSAPHTLRVRTAATATRSGDNPRSPFPIEVASTREPRPATVLDDVRVAVAVRTWNVIRTGRREIFERTLESLRHGGHPFELVLVDNGSTDGTSELVRARGGYAAPRSGANNGAGMGMNIAIERALGVRPAIVVFSDDDIAWRQGFLRSVVQFWSEAPQDVVLLGGYLEPEWPWNTISGVIECGGVRALVRNTTPGGTWTFRAKDWPRIGPLQAEMEADYFACARVRTEGLRICQADLAEHLGADCSTWGNQPPLGHPVDKARFGL